MIGKFTGILSCERIYSLLLGSPDHITEELKFDVTRGINVGIDLNFCAQTMFLINRIKFLLTRSS